MVGHGTFLKKLAVRNLWLEGVYFWEYGAVIMTKTHALMLVLVLALMPVSVHAEGDEWKRFGTTADREEYARDHDLPTYGSSNSGSNCYGYNCDRNDDDDDSDSPSNRMQNSFSSGSGAPSGSMGSIVNNQLQPR